MSRIEKTCARWRSEEAIWLYLARYRSCSYSQRTSSPKFGVPACLLPASQPPPVKELVSHDTSKASKACIVIRHRSKMHVETLDSPCK